MLKHLNLTTESLPDTFILAVLKQTMGKMNDNFLFQSQQSERERKSFSMQMIIEMLGARNKNKTSDDVDLTLRFKNGLCALIIQQSSRIQRLDIEDYVVQRAASFQVKVR